MLPKIADFGLATQLNSDNVEGKKGKKEIGIHLIQLDHYHAPEVILGCGWGFSADIWNFGVLVRYMHFPDVWLEQGNGAHLCPRITTTYRMELRS